MTGWTVLIAVFCLLLGYVVVPYLSNQVLRRDTTGLWGLAISLGLLLFGVALVICIHLWDRI